MKCRILCGLLMLWSAGAWASHIIGGDIALTKQSPTSTNYLLTLTLIYDGVLGSVDDKAFISSFKKSANTRIEDFTLTRSALQEIPYSNARCVPNPRESKITLARYTAMVTFSATNYNDPAGTYFAWEECCRNGGIVNIQTPNKVGLAFYAEIPVSGIPAGLPQFKTPEVKYVCVGKNFEADFGATGTAGNELRYSIVTPLIGSADQGGTFPDKSKAGPYARAIWANGFDSTRAISGLHPLSIDAKTGKIHVNASQIGLFAFAVRCEEWKQGVKVGEVRREFVFNVVDCISSTPAPVFIEILTASPSVVYQSSAGHVSSVEMCKGDSVVLKANDENPQWAYQWLKDDQPIADANSLSLGIYQSGNYTIVKRFAESCGTEESTSNSSRITVKSAPEVRISSSRPLPLCSNDSTNLSIGLPANASIKWLQNGIETGNSSQIFPNVKQPGTYSVSVTDGNTKCVAKDSVVIKLISAPTASLTISGTPVFCANDSVKLITPRNNGYDYAWYQEETPLFNAFENEFIPTQSGRYSVAVYDTATKCTTHSVSINVIVKPSPKVVLDSIPSLCTSSLQAVTLSGTPAGGTFSGQGVVGNRFVSQDLASGTYPITYTYTNEQGCSARDIKNASIAPPPRIEVSKKLTVLRGDSVQIKTLLPLNSTVVWFPTLGLNNPQSLNPVVSPDRTTTYKVTVTTEQGCVAEAEVVVTVIDLIIPNGFTPNNDGSNDSWEIAGIRDFPNCTVEIFNRWGNLVFSNKGYETPWDGRWNGDLVPVGTYYYHIYLREVEYKLTGSLNVIR
ncbi:gliding motility-associated C-terminal domain-containing protein [Runella sp.]|uniref:gliding motility-associated C-terminal domain-containing protein n=1 Tax=Runella sp. TaxID=1960881 RepID=UPI003D0C8116